MLFDLDNLVLTTTWYTFHSQFYQQTGIGSMEGPVSSTTAEIYIQAHDDTAINTPLHFPKLWDRFVDDAKLNNLEHFFHHINNLH